MATEEPDELIAHVRVCGGGNRHLYPAPDPCLSALVIDLGTEYVKALVVEVKEDRAVIIGQGMARHKGSYASDGAISDLETVTR